MRFVGDIIFGRYRASGYSAIGAPGFDVFAKVSPLLQSDLTVGNLETPLVHTLPEKAPNPEGYFFAALESDATKLRRAGFHAMSIANNHALDMGADGLRTTPELLTAASLVPLGRPRSTGAPLVLESLRVRRLKVGLLAVTARLNFAESADASQRIAFVPEPDLSRNLSPILERERPNHDLLIVLIHWGDEYKTRPTRSQQTQAHALIEAGADVVLGHHPHVLSKLERYKSGLIAYSLGNFLFENLNPIPRLTGILGLRFSGRGHCAVEVRFSPLTIKRLPTFHPAVAPPQSAKRVFKLLRPDGLGKGFKIADGQLNLNYDRCASHTEETKTIAR